MIEPLQILGKALAITEGIMSVATVALGVLFWITASDVFHIFLGCLAIFVGAIYLVVSFLIWERWS